MNFLLQIWKIIGILDLDLVLLCISRVYLLNLLQNGYFSYVKYIFKINLSLVYLSKNENSTNNKQLLLSKFLIFNLFSQDFNSHLSISNAILNIYY